MKRVLLFLCLASQAHTQSLKPMTDSYILDDFDPSNPTLTYVRKDKPKKDKPKLFNLSDVENPYVEGTISKDSIFYDIIQKEKRTMEENKKLGLPLTSRKSNYLTSQQFDRVVNQAYENPEPNGNIFGIGFSYNNGKWSVCSKAPEPNTSALILIGLISLMPRRKK